MTNDRQYLIDELNYYECAWHKDDYEKRWQELRDRYKAIHVFPIRMESIGEAIGSFCNWFLYKTVKQDELNVYIPETSRAEIRLNQALLELFSKNLQIVLPEDAMFWKYVVRKHFDGLDVYDMQHQRACYKRMPRPIREAGHPIVAYRKGKNELDRFGLNAEGYVCFIARSAAYNMSMYGMDFDYSHRNMDFRDYILAIRRLADSGLASVRMGRCEQPMSGIEPCLDYAGTAARDDLDLCLTAHCKFFVGNGAGVVFLAGLFARPALMVNLVPATMGFGGMPGTLADMYVPIKYYSLEKQRYMSLREMAYCDVKGLIWAERYKQTGVELHKNTPEEIARAVAEMNARLEGTWKVTEDEKMCMNRYVEVAKEVNDIAMACQRNWNGCSPSVPISYSYLKENMYLLD